MKTFIIICLLNVSILIAKDTTNVHLQDTLIAKSVSENTFWNYNLLQTFISVLAGGVLTLIGVMFSNRHQKKIADKQIKHQLIVAQANIDVAKKQKFLDDLIDQTKNISEHINKMQSNVSYFKIYKSIYNGLSPKQKKYRDKYFDEQLNTNTSANNPFTKEIEKALNKIDEDVDLYYNKSVVLYENILNDLQQIKNISKSIILLFHHSSNNYEKIKNILGDIEKNALDYCKLYDIGTDDFDALEVRYKIILKAITNNLDDITNFTQNIIDEERDSIDHILLIK